MSPGHVVVETAAGTISGQDLGGVVAFRGVPYAREPVGPLRFAPPQPVEPWPGVLAAHEPGPALCQVTRANRDRVAARAALFARNLPGIVPYPPELADALLLDSASESGLCLDIYTPAADPVQALPVYVYYHGGGNSVGSAGGAGDTTSGANLARLGHIVVVQPQYRLGALGWVHGALVDCGPGAGRNLGLQDQMAALEWVHDTIRHFGGDPENITVGGESAGATAVSHLITHPRTRPYLRRAVLQSFTPFMTWSTQRDDEGSTAATLFRDLLGVERFAEVRDADPVDLLAAQSVLPRLLDSDTLHAWRPLGPVRDGEHAVDAPLAALAEPPAAARPLEVMVGFAKDEWQFFRGHSPTVRHGGWSGAVRVLATVVAAPTARRVLEAYATLHPTHDPGDLLSDVCAFLYFKLPALQLADDLARQGTPTYVFQYAYEHPGLDGRLRAPHTGDLPFLFHNYAPEHLARWPSLDGADTTDIRRVAQQMGGLFRAFVHTGRPGRDWPRWDEQDQQVLWFGRAVEARRHLLSRERAVLADAGLGDVAATEAPLARNTREELAHPVDRKL